jgi:hypothetical protein
LRFILLVIIAFRKKDGGISGCNKKSVPKSERFFDDRYICCFEDSGRENLLSEMI